MKSFIVDPFYLFLINLRIVFYSEKMVLLVFPIYQAISIMRKFYQYLLSMALDQDIFPIDGQIVDSDLCRLKILLTDHMTTLHEECNAF